MRCMARFGPVNSGQMVAIFVLLACGVPPWRFTDSQELGIMSSGSASSPQNDDIDNLLAIFTINKLRDLKKHCRAATISEGELANFIMWCRSSGAPFLHTAQHRHFTPEHLTLSDADLAALAANGVGKFKPDAQKAANKVNATFDERRLLSGHLFWNAQTWHFFYFDNHDRNIYKPHWVGGPHIHLINHLWPNRSAENVWEQFCSGNLCIARLQCAIVSDH